MPQKKTFTLKLAFKRLSCLTRKTEFWQTSTANPAKFWIIWYQRKLEAKPSNVTFWHKEGPIFFDRSWTRPDWPVLRTVVRTPAIVKGNKSLGMDLPLNTHANTPDLHQVKQGFKLWRIEATFTLKRQSKIWILVNCVARRSRYFFAREGMDGWMDGCISGYRVATALRIVYWPFLSY